MLPTKVKTVLRYHYGKNLVRPISIDMLKYNIAILTFKNVVETNDCLDNLEKQFNKWLHGFIEFSVSFSRGVITDWPYNIPKLWENILEKKNIFKV